MFTSRAYGIARTVFGLLLIILYGLLLHPQGKYWGIASCVIPGGKIKAPYPNPMLVDELDDWE